MHVTRPQAHLCQGVSRKDMWGLALMMGLAAAAASATYSVSGPEYQHMVPHHVFRDMLITSINLTQSGPLGARMILECNTYCTANSSCASTVLQPLEGLCFLTRSNRCIEMDRSLVRSEGHFYYEKFEGIESSRRTCHASCMMQNTCDDCGRPNCWGNRCQHCAYTCWQRKEKAAIRVSLFNMHERAIVRTVCNGSWHMLWDMSPKPPRQTPSEVLLLRLIITYEDGRELSADFDSVIVNPQRLLSVGNLLKDNGAGNWWNAPFINQSLRFFPESNCHPFYTPNETCNSPTTMAVDEQRERHPGEELERGCPWLTGDSGYDSVRIATFNLWMTCKQCYEEEEDDGED